MDLNNIINIGELIKKVELTQDVNNYGFIPLSLSVILIMVWALSSFAYVDYSGSKKQFVLRMNPILMVLLFLAILSLLLTSIIPTIMIKNENHQTFEQLRYLTKHNLGLKFDLTQTYEKYNEIVTKNDPNEMLMLVNSHIYKLFTQFPTFITKVNNVVILNFESFSNLEGTGGLYHVLNIISGSIILILAIGLGIHFKTSYKEIKDYA